MILLSLGSLILGAGVVGLVCYFAHDRETVGRNEFNLLAGLATEAVKKTRDLDDRVLALEGKPPRPDPSVRPEDNT